MVAGPRRGWVRETPRRVRREWRHTRGDLERVWSVICGPRWQCRPPSCSSGSVKIRRTASAGRARSGAAAPGERRPVAMNPYAIEVALFADFVAGGILAKVVPVWLTAV